MDGNNMMEALKLMIIGMATVICALIIIIQLGKLLISAVNKFFPEEEKPAKEVATATATINPQVAQAINLAVANLTGGKGKVEKIEKI